MITRFCIRNFKRLNTAELELGTAAVFIGPNNSGKTTALQALALWDIGWRRWAEKRDRSSASERQGVTINRRDLNAIPLPSARLLWNDLHTQDSYRSEGKLKTEKIFIRLESEGIEDDQPWRCVLDFYYANEESFYCRLVEGDAEGKVPAAARKHAVVFLPPMSGLAEREYRKEKGEIGVLIGEGQTAQVLRNLCWQLHSQDDKAGWKLLVERIDALFQIRLNDPQYIKERSELVLTYRERNGVELDLSSSGRGCQQVILLLSFLLANPGAVLLLDEPDAHLEILRQRDVYNLITEIAASNGSQIVAASHSEVVLQEAAERDVVMAFVGAPHRIDTRARRGQVKKALESIRMADYYLAEQKGWMLYVEGSTDLAILRRLAQRLGHPAQAVLNDSVPVTYLGSNQPQDARNHFYGLREAKPDLVGYALFDRLDRELQAGTPLTEYQWSRREIENYLVTPDSLRGFVQLDLRENDLIDAAERAKRLEVLERCLGELLHALEITRRPSPWGGDIKVTDEFLDPLMENYFQKLGTPQQLYKRDYHSLADALPLDQLDAEVLRVLDEIVTVAKQATPRQ
ncbi:MAG: AAA family ATPase [Methyloversatilis sp.]|jgi:predicted ATPase|uniref:ATP-dependent nuclease n=1 Tax=Methyloversatilis TaxID=378210 RepID=UPI0025E076ED|nr:AAA family ATPase [Methyloversatilis sp.]MCR6666981.1 AAA family ATPase [Methyloversatilis sp.]